jgi:hypothetical protein
MDIVTVRFTTHWPWNPTSLAIARLGGSREFSHCMTVIDGWAYEATMLHGCRAVPLETAMAGVAMYQDMQVEVPNLAAAVQFGKDQVGKKYDFAGAFGLPFLASDDWSDWSKWWCSEMAFMQLGQAGLWLLDPDERARVTPNDLHQCNFTKSVQIRR